MSQDYKTKLSLKYWSTNKQSVGEINGDLLRAISRVFKNRFHNVRRRIWWNRDLLQGSSRGEKVDK
jgi:hypothetical protein